MISINTNYAGLYAAKAAQDMGLNPVSHLEGGFAAWKKSGNPIETKE